MRNILIFTLLLTVASCLYAKDYTGENNVTKPCNYIFGFGSLVNSDSRAASLEADEVSTALPARISSKFGYKRVWNYQAHGFTALGLVKTDNPSSINGVIYAVSNENMSTWDEREKNYERVEVPWEFVESLSWAKLPHEGKLWVYFPKVSQLPTPKQPLLQSYIDICVSGFLEYGEAFAIEFLETTDGWSEYWLNDRVISRRPWVHFKPHRIVDNLLAQHPKNNNHFEDRAYVAEWLMTAKENELEPALEHRGM